MAITCGLQLQSVREILRFDPMGTIEKVAEMGFHHIELINHLAADEPENWYGLEASALKTLADRVKVHIIGGYVKGLRPDNADSVIKYYADLGSERIVIPIDYFPNRETLNEKCAMYNRLGEMCRKHGLSLHYENHYHELQQIEGGTVFDLLLAQTEPELFHISLNNYWLMRGLADPVKVFGKYAPRVGSLVLQDYPLDQIDKFNVWTFYRHHPISRNIRYDKPLRGGEIENINPVHCALFTELGTGICKLRELIEEADAAGSVKYVLIKQDYTRLRSEFESVKVSMENCRHFAGLRWY